MDYSRFHISVPCVAFSSTEGALHKYCIKVVYGKLEWEIYHRFSDFHTLSDTLHNVCELQALPPPPPKLFLRPRDRAILEERRIMLENWVKFLSRRPDVRTSNTFLDFIEFEANTNTTVEPLAPQLLGTCDEAKLQLSDAIFYPDTRSIIVSYQETTSMSRVGKVWSLVECEELGGLAVFGIRQMDSSSIHHPTNLASDYTLPLVCKNTLQMVHFDKTVQMGSPYRFSRIYFSPLNNRLFVALPTGVVQVYQAPPSLGFGQRANSSLRCGFSKETEITLHTESILSLRGDNGYPGRFVTAGYDNAIRVVNCNTLETTSGGNLSKRLEYKERITVAIIEPAHSNQDDDKSRVFVGSTKGNVFIYSLQTNPPEYRTTIPCNESIGALELAGCNLLIAHKFILSIYRIGVFGEEGRFSLVSQLNPNLSSGRTICSIAVSISVPLLFLGHSRAITVWDCHDKVCVAAFKAHYKGVRSLSYIGNPSSVYLPHNSTVDKDHILLLSGGGDSCVKLWKFFPAHEYRSGYSGGDSVSGSAEPSRLVSSVNETIPSGTPSNDFPLASSDFNMKSKKETPYDLHEAKEVDIIPASFIDSLPHRH